jgi:hypothetical protein
MPDWVFPATVHTQPSAILPATTVLFPVGPTPFQLSLRLIKALVHFLARLEVRHVLLIDGDEGAISRIATVPRRAVFYAERTKPT